MEDPIRRRELADAGYDAEVTALPKDRFAVELSGSDLDRLIKMAGGRSYQQGYEDGTAEGYEVGHDDGHLAGHNDGYDDAIRDVKALADAKAQVA